MDVLFKCVGLAFISVILGLSIGKKEFGIILTVMTCAVLGIAFFAQIQPILNLVSEIGSLGNIRSDFLSVLLKAAGIAVISDFAGTVCQDSGNGSVAKMLHLGGRILIMNLSLPVVRSLISVLQEMLHNI